MKIIVAADDWQESHLRIEKENATTLFVKNGADFFQYTDAEVFIDLTLNVTEPHLQLLRNLLPQVVIVNSVLHTCTETDEDFIRMNGWNTFLQSDKVEAATKHGNKQKAERAFQALGKEVTWVPDVVGFIRPRVVSMIINEAYFALQEGVSKKEEINIAMKLGTNYPFGPFEWAETIGQKNVAALLKKLSLKQDRYSPAPNLVQEADML